MTEAERAPEASGQLSYAQAGVDIEAGDRAVDLIRAAVARTARPEVVGGIGGFAGLFDASRLTRYRRHQGDDRAAAWRLRHDRDRPGGHGGRRSCRVRGRAAVPDRLRGVRPG